jgi:hypothetical protein
MKQSFRVQVSSFFRASRMSLLLVILGWVVLYVGSTSPPAQAEEVPRERIEVAVADAIACVEEDLTTGNRPHRGDPLYDFAQNDPQGFWHYFWEEFQNQHAGDAIWDLFSLGIHSHVDKMVDDLLLENPDASLGEVIGAALQGAGVGLLDAVTFGGFSAGLDTYANGGSWNDVVGNALETFAYNISPLDNFMNAFDSNLSDEERAQQALIGIGTLAGDVAMVGSMLQSGGATEPPVQLWRAVKDAELTDIQTTGIFRNPPGIENKYFTTTLDGAIQFGEMASNAFGDGPYTIVQTSIGADLITPEMSVVVDRGIPTVVVPTEVLPELSPPTILPITVP